MSDTQKTVAVVLAADYEDSELEQPVKTLEHAGFHCELIGEKSDEEVRGKRGGKTVITKAVDAATVSDYVALVIPGGYSPDHLRINDTMVAFVREFFRSGKPVAAICHGPQLLIEADVVNGRRVTSWPSVRTDLINAGAQWQDREVVVDGNLITSRKPADLDAFGQALLDQLGD